MLRIDEETIVLFSHYDQLSYKDYDGPDVKLYVDNIYIGDIKVWLDSEMNDREYICVNYEIIYLDTLKMID